MVERVLSEDAPVWAHVAHFTVVGLGFGAIAYAFLEERGVEPFGLIVAVVCIGMASTGWSGGRRFMYRLSARVRWAFAAVGFAGLLIHAAVVLTSSGQAPGDARTGPPARSARATSSAPPAKTHAPHR